MKSKLSIRQMKALPVLVASKTAKDGCKAAGIAEKTYYEWLKIPLFRERLEREQRGVCEKTLSQLQESMEQAFMTLRNLLRSKSENVQVRAADSLLGFGLRMKELEEVEKRLASIEQIILERRIHE